MPPFFVLKWVGNMTSDKTEEIIHYHEATKHHFERYARSLGYMDWGNQPNPFRIYRDTPVLKLPLLKTDPPASYLGLYERQDHTSQPFVIGTIAGFLELSLGLSAWKASGSSRWSLRINPSSGNLHPTEAHLILPSLDAHPAGIYHYNALDHALERRADLPRDRWQSLVSHFGSDGFLIAVTSILWRESWKYGERAFRYCNHDAGHALACLSFAANLFGWKCIFLNELSDEELEAILGFEQIRFRKLQEEHTDCLCFIFPSARTCKPKRIGEMMQNQHDMQALLFEMVQKNSVFSDYGRIKFSARCPGRGVRLDRSMLTRASSSLSTISMFRVDHIASRSPWNPCSTSRVER